jgi:hypothetical protein
MKRQIRAGVFETNSSSTHTIAIAKHLDDDNRDTRTNKYYLYDEWEDGEFEFGRQPKIENSIGKRIAYAVLVFLEYPNEIVSVDERRKFYGKIYDIIDRNMPDKPKSVYDDTKETVIANVMKLIQFCEWACYHWHKEWEPAYTMENEIIDKDHYAYVDHTACAKKFYERITTDDSALERFIMAENSFVYAGGDEWNGYYMSRVGFEYDYDDSKDFFKAAKSMAKKLDVELFFKGN